MDHGAVIDALGGNTELSLLLGGEVSPKAISNWRERGVAHKFRPAVAALARRRRLKLPPDFLTMPAEAA